MYLTSFSGSELIGLASSFAILIGENKPEDELVLLATFATALADNFAILAAAKAFDNKNSY